MDNNNSSKSRIVIELTDLIRTHSDDKIDVIAIQSTVIRDLQEKVKKLEEEIREDDYWLGRYAAERDAAQARVKELEMDVRALLKKNGRLEADLSQAKETIQMLKQIGKGEK